MNPRFGEQLAGSRRWTDHHGGALIMEPTGNTDNQLLLRVDAATGRPVSLPLHQVRALVAELVHRGARIGDDGYGGCVNGGLVAELIVDELPGRWKRKARAELADQVLAAMRHAGITVLDEPAVAASIQDCAAETAAGDEAANNIPAASTPASAPEDDPIGTVRARGSEGLGDIPAAAIRSTWGAGRSAWMCGMDILEHADVRDWPVIGAVPGTPAAEYEGRALLERAESTVASVLIDHDWHPDAARAASDEDYRQHFARMARAAIDAYQEATLTPVVEQRDVVDAERRALREIAENLGLDVDTAPDRISAAVLLAVTVRSDQRQALDQIAAAIGITNRPTASPSELVLQVRGLLYDLRTAVTDARKALERVT